MQGKKPKYMLVLLMIFSIFIVSCSKQAESRISRDLQYLCSDECGGRKPGTEGNIKAGDYIAKRFKEMALNPLESDYKIPYKQKAESINEINLELLDAVKSVHKFEYGKDYIEFYLDDIILTLPIYNEPANEDCIVLTDNFLKANEYQKDIGSPIKMIIVKGGGEKSKPACFYNKGKIPQITVSEEAFDILYNNIGKTVRFSADIDVQEKELSNIVSVIKGENSGSALLISAHFDHIGSIGKEGSDNYIIWRGAFDNASGVCTMLETARYLKDMYKDKEPSCDIIFCAFNDEERLSSNKAGFNYKGGSRYFLEYIKGKYSSVFDINLDCLGSNDSSTLLADVNPTNESKEASEKILNNLKGQNVDVKLSREGFSSDHKTFKHAILLSTPNDTSIKYTHTLEDTPDIIDMAFLSQISEKLAYCIRDTIDTIGIDKMNLIETTGNTNTDNRSTLLTPSSFEEKFNCKLDFLDFKQAKISILSRAGVFTQPNEGHAPAEDISSIRDIMFFMESGYISFTTCKTGNEIEKDIYKREMEMNGFNDKSKAQQISINKNPYYILTKEDEESKYIVSEFAGSDIIIRVCISYPDFYEFNSDKQYEDFFIKKGLDKLINGMTLLLQERG